MKKAASRNQSKPRHKKINDRSLVSSIRTINKSEASRKNTPPKLSFKNRVIDNSRRIANIESQSDREVGYPRESAIIQYADTARDEYIPSSTLFDDDYVPFCNESGEMRIEEARLSSVGLDKPPRDYHTSTTRAESNLCLPPAYPIKHPQSNKDAPTEAQEYFSSKFAEISEEKVNIQELVNQPGHMPDGEKSLTRRLHDLIKHIAQDIRPSEIKREPDESVSTRQWSSLNTGQRPDSIRDGLEVDNRVDRDMASSHGHPTSHQSLPSETYMVALYDFEGEKSKDLTFKRGDLVRLIDKKANGWWLAEADSRIGFVPSNYLVARQAVSHN